MPIVVPGLVRCSSLIPPWLRASLPSAILPLAGATLARPKSRILAWPRLVTKMFAGLISRWTMPSECAASSASAISMAERQQRFGFQRTPGDAVLQGDSVQELHHDERLAFMLADLVNGADVGMVQGRGSASLAAKAFQRLRILRDFFGQEFQRDEAAELRVFGLVNHAHAPAAEFLDDAVVRDSLAEQAGKASSFGAHVICPTRASQRLSERGGSIPNLRGILHQGVSSEITCRSKSNPTTVAPKAAGPSRPSKLRSPSSGVLQT